jgi:hypothetical protein
MDVSGNLIKPDQNEVYKLIKLSNSYKFLSDPKVFFKKSNQLIKPNLNISEIKKFNVR